RATSPRSLPTSRVLLRGASPRNLVTRTPWPLPRGTQVSGTPLARGTRVSGTPLHGDQEVHLLEHAPHRGRVWQVARLLQLAAAEGLDRGLDVDRIADGALPPRSTDGSRLRALTHEGFSSGAGCSAGGSAACGGCGGVAGARGELVVDARPVVADRAED